MSRSPGSARPMSLQHTIIKVIVLSVLWLSFSGKVDALHLGYGAFSVALVVWATRDLMLSKHASDASVSQSRIHWPTALTYLPWLLWQILIANIAVAKLILSPRLAIDPVLVQLDTVITSGTAPVVFGNSVTLTPGTITLEAERGRFLIHALQRDAVDGLLPVARRVSRLFGEPETGSQRLTFHESSDETELT